MSARYLICDHLRLHDLQRMDTTADTADTARQLAEELATRYGCAVHVLAVVGTVECPGRAPEWTKPIYVEGQ